jgi:CitMHS family citrate-Mg2+:H+ or citrate-Ca2+:H+ symporter
MVEAMFSRTGCHYSRKYRPYLAPITAVISMPLTFMSNDAFYFGVLPVLEAAGHYGITPVEMARASIVGQPVHFTVPIGSIDLLTCGLAGN